jgi:pyruvate dehydrogenase E2 component (dihydrolipoamide acetyltransferase)
MAEIKNVVVPDIGNFKDVSIIEVGVKAGDSVKAEQTLITLETDKATMDVPAPFEGVVKELKVKVGDKVSEGSLIALMVASGAAVTPATSQAAVAAPAAAPAPAPQAATAPAAPPAPAPAAPVAGGKAHASPSIRRFARELGVDLAQVKGSGEKGRVTKDDVQNFVKQSLAQPRGAAGGGALPGLLPWPEVDFAKFGAIESKPLSRIKKISGANLHRNWVMIPHVTQFEEADISEMEAFRKELGAE